MVWQSPLNILVVSRIFELFGVLLRGTDATLPDGRTWMNVFQYPMADLLDDVQTALDNPSFWEGLPEAITLSDDEPWPVADIKAELTTLTNSCKVGAGEVVENAVPTH